MNLGKHLLIICSFITLLLLLLEVKAHFLSIEDLEEFYDLEQKLKTVFTSYLDEQKTILEVVKQRYDNQKKQKPNITDPDQFLGNPLNVYGLLKRLVQDWPLTMALLGGGLFTTDDEEGEEEPIELPSKEEYLAAVRGIHRIQQIYNISIADLVSGRAFQHTDNASKLNAEDCFAIAKDLYRTRHYLEAMDWLKEALRQIQGKEGEVSTSEGKTDQDSPPTEQIFEYLALTSCFIGNQKKSSFYFQKLYYNFPDFRPTQQLIKDHLLAVNDSCKRLVKNNDSLKPLDHTQVYNLTASEDEELTKQQQQLCKVETIPNATLSRLRCHRITFNKPHLRIQPFKAEVLHENPPVVVYHDVIHPSEIDYFTQSNFEENVNGLVSEFWGKLDEDQPIHKKLARRVKDFTDFYPHITENQLFLANTAAGGETALHHDAETRGLEINPRMGPPEQEDKVATAMFYLEEPQAGGLTILPRLGVSVAPKRGAAIVWMNLFRNGDLDDRAIYGSCPIIRGQQWTLSLWLGESPRPFEAQCNVVDGSDGDSGSWSYYR